MRHPENEYIGKVSEDFARRLQDSPIVERVLHPALPSCPGQAFWKRDMGKSTEVFSIGLEDPDDLGRCRGARCGCCTWRLSVFL